MTGDWRIFDALTCDHPMLADIEDWMLPPKEIGGNNGLP
jgi:hypothetical protein